MDFTADKPARATTMSYCSSTPILLDPTLLKFLSQGVRCKVQLVTEELELDAYDMPVPKDWKIIELVVLDDSKETIELLVASTPEYLGYRVTDYWQVIDDTEPF